ncbi:hypothetical protein DL762_001517 [Monosporascus cannonballus]|uniref:FAD-binding domain-containing protein n=1 Tax=Monosporascus cannonballus TaxID=155416 RepID=A0ABY0HFY6_9PEZI|nr:hypothetical protein DL762_001517 [Monosporascus cannonballus]
MLIWGPGEPERPNGEVFKADLVVGVDGINSSARLLLTGQPDVPRDTRGVAYRILIPRKKLLADPELADPDHRHMHDVVTRAGQAPCRLRDPERGALPRGGLRDLVQDAGEVRVIKGDNRELCNRLGKWGRHVQKLCALTGGFMKWRLCDLPNLMCWAHPLGKAVLLDDSCHPMRPYMAQGRRASRSRTPRRCGTREPYPGQAREHQYILHIEDNEEQRAGYKRLRANASETKSSGTMMSAGSSSSVTMLRSLLWRVRIGRWLRGAAVAMLTKARFKAEK